MFSTENDRNISFTASDLLACHRLEKWPWALAVASVRGPGPGHWPWLCIFYLPVLFLHFLFDDSPFLVAPLGRQRGSYYLFLVCSEWESRQVGGGGRWSGNLAVQLLHDYIVKTK